MEQAASSQPSVPRFSVDYMDRSVDPTVDFYGYATGTWRRNNPVPADKAIWGGFTELIERNFMLLRALLESAGADRSAAPDSPRRQVGDFYASALDQVRRESVGFAPIRAQLDAIERIGSVPELVHTVAALHDSGVAPFFQPFVHPDRRHSSVYAFYVYQGGIGLPDREYYLAPEFDTQRVGYQAHVARMFRLLGDPESTADSEAATIVSIETELARASRSATDLRDDVKNHHPFPVAELATRFPGFPWTAYLADRHAESIGYVVVGQPEFFTSLEAVLAQRNLADLKVYLRWHVLHAIAPYLQPAVEREDFEFFHRVLQGQPEPEPDWKLAARAIDDNLGEALGALYVERHFPPDARARMVELVSDLRAVFRDRLKGLDWMTEPTRQKALTKFDRFTTKIGHPERFRDYSSVVVRRDDYAGNWQRAVAFEVHRQMARIGGTVDRSEWGMTPQTVNAYFSPTQNEIVFPAGILQPPFFDATMDDAVNYGAIGAVIGHEITHGYDDQGRRFDADGNLGDWWSEADAREFEARAKVVVAEYSRQEGLPGVFVNGELTLGENIADFGGVSLAYEALERRLAADPSRRTTVDGLTPEQRFFLSWAQVWRQNCREPERRRRLTVDPHSPGDIRAVTPAILHPQFAAAFPPKGPTPTAAPRVRIW
ncbi:MAG: M13 family metallopeptidase [Thermoplasmata archaeon]|nr:M13 family metallopeptidase [Thermoplasmata archaeon]